MAAASPPCDSAQPSLAPLPPRAATTANRQTVSERLKLERERESRFKWIPIVVIGSVVACERLSFCCCQANLIERDR